MGADMGADRVATRRGQKARWTRTDAANAADAVDAVDAVEMSRGAHEDAATQAGADE
jgi:hypothetical protein